MPRVRSTNQPTYAESPAKKVTIPLNDDLHEKAARLQSRKLLASKQLDTLKAAASPHRSKSHRASDGAPHTPSQDENRAAFDDGVTPMKRVPLLANFEEWMKMATDNKINAANSWNFALIDYFHDMSLLREGDGVNFQKASCTLDGCVKIYTSRVDSVATETGKLLSGLAMEGGGKKGKSKGGDEEGEEGEGSEGEGDGEGKKKGRKKVQRSAEATLATSFESLRLKKMELEFSVDPLFKKAAADFDEGGAKGLLMNHLSIDNTGRIVFDSSDDVQDDANEAERRDSLEPDSSHPDAKSTSAPQPEDGPVNLSALASRFFPDLGILDEQVICPSLQTFELGAGESSSLDLPFLKAPENWRDGHPESLPTHEDGEDEGRPDNNPAFSEDDEDANGLGATFDAGPETGFGEGGEAWARDAALHAHAQPPLHNIQDGDGEAGEGGEVGTFDVGSGGYGITLQHRPGAAKDEENILNYFDTALSKNWAGPEHWKIARIKSTLAGGVGAEKRVRKEKEPFEIDFGAALTAELAGGLYTKASSNNTISLPRAQWRSKGRNLLPDDKHFNSKDLLKLFLKPKARLGSRKTDAGLSGRKVGAGGEVLGDVDAAFWAANGGVGGQGVGAVRHPMDDDEDGGAQGDYDANFFQDDGLPLPHGGGGEDEDEGLEFADAVEYAVAGDFDAADAGGGATSGPDGAGIDSLGMGGTQETAVPGTFGAELVSQSRRVRPEYVQYARTAKKVDVRRLKENMWRGMGLSTSADHPSAVPQTPSQPPLPSVADKDEEGGLRFTDIMNGLQTVYPKQQMGDISTSYGFICLLHLANEKGLVVENVVGWGDLRVRIDGTARDLEHDGTDTTPNGSVQVSRTHDGEGFQPVKRAAGKRLREVTFNGLEEGWLLEALETPEASSKSSDGRPTPKKQRRHDDDASATHSSTTTTAAVEEQEPEPFPLDDLAIRPHAIETMDKEMLQELLFQASTLSSITKHIIEAEFARQQEREREEVITSIDFAAEARKMYETEMRKLNSGRLVEEEIRIDFSQRGFIRRNAGVRAFIPRPASEYEWEARVRASSRIESKLRRLIEDLQGQVTHASSYGTKRNALVALCKLAGWIHDPV
ncbi:hypothetical protein LTR10_010125 [Elasticomyces elasticus]|nr:hypothetical protein LTR10_010125 [Elasticomyces elasticus]KAK4970415.1 hypothetical protein LTR42_008584 [Elasticomyces elasticus]